MIIDNYLTFSGSYAAGVWTPQLVTALGLTLATNVVDLANTRVPQPADFGAGEQLKFEISVFNTVTSGGGATVQFQAIQSDDAAQTVNVGVLVQTDAFPISYLTAGAVLPLILDRANPYPARRYLGFRYNVGTAALTNAVGQFVVNLVKDFQDKGNNTIFNSGFVVQ